MKKIFRIRIKSWLLIEKKNNLKNDYDSRHIIDTTDKTITRNVNKNHITM